MGIIGCHLARGKSSHCHSLSTVCQSPPRPSVEVTAAGEKSFSGEFIQVKPCRGIEVWGVQRSLPEHRAEVT